MVWYSIKRSALGAETQTRNSRVLRTAQTRVSGLAKCPCFPGPRVFSKPGFHCLLCTLCPSV